MRLYLDNSFLNRPFDDPEVGTNKLEAEVLSLIIKLETKSKIKIVNSSIIEYENSLNTIPERRIFVEEILKRAKMHQNINEKIKTKADKLVKTINISPLDALHLASAESSKADVFITCDYDIIKKYTGKVKAITPLEFIQQYEHSSE